MSQPHKRGALIVIDGIDGGGKSTQVRLLVDALRAAGEDVVASREPTDGPWGTKIRQSEQSGRKSPEDELDAFIQDRRQHVAELIQPALDRGALVVLDRSYLSTIAYQGSRGSDVERTQALMQEFPAPTLTIVIDIEPRGGLERVSGRDGAPNLFEQVDQLEAARAIFRAFDATATVHVDGDRTIEEVHREIVGRVTTFGGPLQHARCPEPSPCSDPVLCRGDACGWTHLHERLRAASHDQ